MSLAPRLPDPNGVTFLVRSVPGSGRTAFALALARSTRKPILVIGSDRGIANLTLPPTMARRIEYRPIEDVSSIDDAIAHLEDHAEAYGGLVVDTMSDWWAAEKRDHDLDESTPHAPRDWRPLKEEHECRLRILQSLGLPIVLLADERPVFERTGETIAEVGVREVTERRDSMLADVRLRLFRKKGKKFMEVLKDRTGRYPMGAVVEDPALEEWIPSASTTAPARKGTRRVAA